MTEWHTLETQDAVRQIQSDLENGLTAVEAARRLEEFGPNELVERVGISPWAILLEQFKGIMVVMLIISAIVSMILGETIDAVVIMIIVILNAVLGFVQEYRAEQAMAALKRMAVPHVRVRRDGHLQEVTAFSLVPGDIIQLETGNTVPADARLLETANLRVQEAVLTGESEAVEKDTAPLVRENLPLGDRVNSVYMGTVVTYGHGMALVTDTGMKTQLGKIADMLQSVGTEKTPLQRRLEQLARGLALAALVLVAIVFVLGLLRGENWIDLFRVSVAMAVAAVPEGLPAVVTIALAVGAAQTSYGYTGEYSGDSTELLYLRARNYHTDMGRFITRDIWTGDVDVPMSYNKWLYVYSNPINHTDPSGFEACKQGTRYCILNNGGYLDTLHFGTSKILAKQLLNTLQSKYGQPFATLTLRQSFAPSILGLPKVYYQTGYVTNFPVEGLGDKLNGVALGIFMDFQFRYEDTQLIDPRCFTILGWFSHCSAYSNEDIPSDYLGFISEAKDISFTRIVEILGGGEASENPPKGYWGNQLGRALCVNGFCGNFTPFNDTCQLKIRQNGFFPVYKHLPWTDPLLMLDPIGGGTYWWHESESPEFSQGTFPFSLVLQRDFAVLRDFSYYYEILRLGCFELWWCDCERVFLR
jgi:RHS repeat-associated protein